MGLDMTEQERNLLLELIERAEEAAIRSMDHADTRDFKNILRERLELLASIKEKIQSYSVQAA